MTARFGSTEPNRNALACSCPAVLAPGNCVYGAYGGGGNCICEGGDRGVLWANAWAVARQVGAVEARERIRRRGGQGTVLVAVALVPSRKLKSAVNGKPPRGHVAGSETPFGAKLTLLPWTRL
jgi:hypothetical protein